MSRFACATAIAAAALLAALALHAQTADWLNMGLQRGWRFIENATGLAQLAGKRAGQCALILGSLKLVSASGAPSRVLAMCRRS